MKTLMILAVLVMGTIAWGETTCTHLTYRDSTLCTAEDGSGVLFDYTSGSLTESRYKDAAEWSTLYNKLVQEDAAKVAARVSQLKAVAAQSDLDTAKSEAHHAAFMKAASITKKKDCLAAGFDWTRGGCFLKSDK